MFEYSGIRLKWPRERPSRRHWAMGQGTEGPDILRLDLNIPRAMQEEAIEVIEKVGWYKMNQNDTKVIDMVIDMRDSHLWIRKCLKYLKHLKYLKYIPSTTKCLRSPLGINSRVLEWGSRAILDSRPLTLPHCRPLEVLIPGVVFFFLCCSLLLPPTSDIYGSCGSRYLESLVPIVLGTVQSARNFGYWKVYHFWSRISTCIYGTLRVFTAFYGTFKSCRTWCAKRWSAVFMCKKVYVHMGHGPWIWNYRFGGATSWTKTCKVHKRG